ncbi:vitamin K epoxide reductase family protein [Streptomyces sp. WMMC1477]|uniref:vitamin K epoxide reductase family protein n=1 Tax=unclassified Streptomyces TaxID=2593676 RepID=UPI003FCC4AFC
MMTHTAPSADGTEATDDAERSPLTLAASRAFAWMLVVTGFAGLLAAWVITNDKFNLLQAKIDGEEYTPACSLNPIVSCGDVMESDQAEAFGFPNPMLGLVTYGVVIAIGAGLLAGARYRPWFWRSMLGGTFFGVSFCTWLMYQSLYNINALCLWCTLAWVATLTMFWYTLWFNLRHRLVPAPEGLRKLFLEFHWLFPVAHVGIIGMLILTRWWYFWVG